MTKEIAIQFWVDGMCRATRSWEFVPSVGDFVTLRDGQYLVGRRNIVSNAPAPQPARVELFCDWEPNE